MARAARVSQRVGSNSGDSVARRPEITKAKASKHSLDIGIADLGRISSTKKLSRVARAVIDQAENGENRQRFVKQMDEAYSFFEGDQWINDDGSRSNAPSWRYRMNRNVTFGMVEAQVSLLMDMRSTPYWAADFPTKGDEAADFLAKFGLPPLPEAQGQGSKKPKTDADFATHLTDMLHAQYERRDEHTRMEGIFLDMVVAGLGIEKTFWDRKNNRPGVMQIDPRDFLIDSRCTDRRLETAKLVVVRDRVDVDELRWRFGLSRSKIDRIVDQAATKEEVILRDRGGFLQRANYGSAFKDTDISSDELKRTMVDIYHIWFDEDTLFGHEADGESDSKFPEGRIVGVAGEEIITDMGNPYAKKREGSGEIGGHGKIPFALYRNYGNPRDPYGFGDITPMKGNQIAINVLWSFMMQGAALTGNPQWIYEEGALRTDWLTNEPGLAIEVPRGMIDRIQRMDGMRVSQDFYNLVGMLEDNIEKQTNVNPALEGESPGSHASGIHVKQLQDAAFKRIRQKLRNSDSGLRTRFYQEVRNTQQFHTLEEFLDHMGDGEWLNFDDRMRTLKGDVRIRAAADEPTTPAEKLQRAVELMNVGALDALGMVDQAELTIPDDLREALMGRRRLEVLNNTFQELQLQQQIQQMQQPQQPPQLPGGQAPPGPGGPQAPGGFEEQLGLQPDPAAGIPPVEAAPPGGPQGAIPQFA